MTGTPHSHAPTRAPLELCPNGSLMNMRHHCRIFTEREVRFFMVQLIVPKQSDSVNAIVDALAETVAKLKKLN